MYAVLASMEALVPILASFIFTNLYSATIELQYPWNASFYFCSLGLTIIGKCPYLDYFTDKYKLYCSCPDNSFCVFLLGF